MPKNASPEPQNAFDTLLSIERKLYQVSQSFMKLGHSDAANRTRTLLRDVSTAIEQYAGS